MKTLVVAASVVAIVVAVIIVNAPPPDNDKAAGRLIPIAAVFAIVEAENDVVRELWTKQIVEAGQKNGLRFDKDWREPSVEAGPLPALFLRETAESLRRSPVPLYLFLGSDFPINDANKFTGLQTAYFNEIKRTGEPQFFFDGDIRFQTAMFADIAVTEACVSCHNNEPETTKTEWKLGDIMGATTWSYPRAEVSMEEVLSMVSALRRGFRDAYEEYLAKTATFAPPPVIGQNWPVDGYFLPSTDVFMEEVERTASPRTIRRVLELNGPRIDSGVQESPAFRQESHYQCSSPRTSKAAINPGFLQADSHPRGDPSGNGGLPASLWFSLIWHRTPSTFDGRGSTDSKRWMSSSTPPAPVCSCMSAGSGTCSWRASRAGKSLYSCRCINAVVGSLRCSSTFTACKSATGIWPC